MGKMMKIMGFKCGNKKRLLPMRKKGIFFTFIAMAMMVVFLLVFTPQNDASLQQNTQATATRIETVNNYVNSLEDRYFKTVLKVTTQKTIISLIFYMNETSSYVTNLDSAFFEIMLNGTINKAPIDSITRKSIMNDSTLLNWSDRIIKTSKNVLNVNTTIKFINASVSQTSPWSIDSELILNISVKSNVAEWNKTALIAASIDIEGLYDPYYLVNTNRAYGTKVKKSGVSFNQWNISHVRVHIRNGTYVHWQNSDAPSFLMRFTNTTSNSSCCGIESLVNPNRITPSDQIESYADYLFWNHTFNARCSELYNITNPSTGGGLWDEFRYFKLDSTHLTRYNITAIDAVKTC